LSNILKSSHSSRVPVAADGNITQNALHVSGLSISGSGRPSSGDILKAHSSSQLSSKSPFRPQTTEPRPVTRLNNYTSAKSMTSLKSAGLSIASLNISKKYLLKCIRSER
jgi:hypothetical protein